jgi:hypothetical protein
MAAPLRGETRPDISLPCPLPCAHQYRRLLICRHKKAMHVADVAELFDMLNEFVVYNVGLTRTQSPRTGTEGN